jgi:hypothetical protein
MPCDEEVLVNRRRSAEGPPIATRGYVPAGGRTGVDTDTLHDTSPPM